MVRVAWQDQVGPWLAIIAQVLRGGGLAVIPTDTLYGFAARYDRPTAVRRIATLKGRDPARPFLLLISDRTMLERLVAIEPPAPVLDLVWPGPVTVLLPGLRALDPMLRGENDSVAVRLPADAALAALIAQVGVPILSTSVNHQGEVPLTDLAAIERAFGARVDLLADGGPRAGRAPSAIVDLCRRPPVLVRSGARAIDLQRLERRWQAAEASERGRSAP
jgi:L-threonylcarbamoyladenylate synthase